MNRKALTLVFPLAFLFCAQAYAQTVDELIKKSLDAKGGVQKLKALKSFKATARLVQQGM